MIPDQLKDEVDALKNAGYMIDMEEKGDSFIHVIIRGYTLPKGYSKNHTALLIKVPMSYPNGKPDMFWSDADLILFDGRGPKSTSKENIFGTEWLRFSWHPGKWNPGNDNLETYLGFVNSGLKQARNI
jgi:hypothetical protein